MNKKYLTILTLLTLAVISACGPAPTPTLSAADLQGTAIADAWAAVTLTQAAMPTATATLTPSPTETPTATFVVFPTIPPLQPALVAPAGSPTIDPCNDIPPKEPKGTVVQVRFINKTEGNVNLSFGMIKPNNLGECGTYTFPLSRYDERIETVLAGCYWGFGWVDTPSTAKTPDYLCVTDTTKAVAIWITAEVINFH